MEKFPSINIIYPQRPLSNNHPHYRHFQTLHTRTDKYIKQEKKKKEKKTKRPHRSSRHHGRFPGTVAADHCPSDKALVP